MEKEECLIFTMNGRVKTLTEHEKEYRKAYQKKYNIENAEKKKEYNKKYHAERNRKRNEEKTARELAKINEKPTITLGEYYQYLDVGADDKEIQEIIKSFKNKFNLTYFKAEKIYKEWRSQWLKTSITMTLNVKKHTYCDKKVLMRLIEAGMRNIEIAAEMGLTQDCVSRNKHKLKKEGLTI